MDPFQDLTIYVRHSALSRRWFWVARLGDKKVAEGHGRRGRPFRTRKAALIGMTGWLLKIRWRPR
jgi:hypothetical protein